MKSVVVTGVSTGIGRGVAKVLLAKGFSIYGSVRKRADADRLRAEFGANFVPLLFDITDEAAVLAAAREVRTALKGETLAGLVNNAGIAISGALLELSIDDFRRQIEINLTGQVIVTQAFAPLLGADASLKGEPGRIVMMSSVSGRRAFPFVGPYASSKHALEGLSESLRREMMLFGIRVIIIAPGAINTPIWDKAEGIDIAAYKNSPFLAALERARAAMQAISGKGLPPERVGELVHRVLTISSPRVRYAIVPNRLEYLVSRILPRRVLDRIIARRLGLLPKKG
jgi:NAD(P)-dependent dehydrogenase (short-subunit alcohol dehydrogenase family)